MIQTGMRKDIFVITYTTADNRVDIAVCDARDAQALKDSGQLVTAKGPYHTLSLRELDYAATHRHIIVPGHTQREDIN